ncbi:MAG: carboxypeptidase-like regulatory domain-containing protein [Chitinophagaceae bacterium]|nr:carboxypeptidase-like regulatory domain-containing protein [Chitinophagaceae bacterium]
MRKISFLLMLSIYSLLANAQKIKGIITDNTGKILPFASVFIKENNKGTNANSEGKYSLKPEPGRYTLVCQHVGYKKEERKITVTNDDQEQNFVLNLQEMTLSEVIIKNGEDPAYQIIRNAIKKRTYFESQLASFQCEVYTKGQMRVRNYPKKFFGRKVDFEDGDTSKQKMLYLSETISKYFVDKPNKEKIEVISSKVSGQSDGFGLSAPRFLSLYANNVFIGENLNPRGFVSPIAENALNFYRYKLEGAYFEDGREISHIKVIPKRTYEPLFSGYIDIVADEWRIHSAQLQLTKASQMELVDTLRIEQLYRPLNKEVWYISSQVIYPAIKILGFDAYGSFVNIYSNFNVEPVFDKKTFSSTILKYTDSSNKKTTEYWEKARPVPLMADEIKDYKRKDSLELAKKDPAYLDSLEKVRNKITLANIILLGQSFQSERKRTSISYPSLLELVSFNPAEGWVANPSFAWTKKLDTTSSGRRSISIAPTLRYGFSNKHFNAHLTVGYTYGKKYATTITFSGGSRVFQFNNNSPIGQRGNTISCLFSEENRIKSYEAVYFRGSFRKGIGNGFTFYTGFQYQDRKPLNNTSNYTWRDKPNREYTPNYPDELVSANIKRHQVFMATIGMNWQPGARYIELPDRKINIGSKYPVFSAQYTQGFKDVFGSDESFSKWKLGITDDINFKLQGKFRYRLGMGGFVDTGRNVQVPDYNHFNGNISTFATEYLNSFQLLPIYLFSNISRFYVLAHVEHNFKGFLTNKIPGIKKLNLYLVAGANGFYINGNKNYYEIFAGFDNIFKQLRIDFVQSYRDGKAWQNGIRIGFSRISGRRGDDWP